MQQLEYIVLNSDKTPSVFEEFEKRFIDIDIRHEKDKHDLSSRILNVKKSTSDFRFLVQTNEEKANHIDSKIESFR